MMRNIGSFIGSIFKSPYGVVFIATAVWHGVVWWFKIPFNPVISVVVFLLDMAVAFIFVDRLTYFFSQFVLPIQNPKDRQKIFERVQTFDTGGRGPTLFVKNGRVIKHPGEEDKRGPGVIVLDTASAVVLRTDTQIIGPVGPGVRFTEGNEYIASDLGVDLRAQWQYVGPHKTDQPFLNPISNPKVFNDIERRRLETVGLTRDGFEVSPTISIKYRIKRPPRNQPTESGVLSRYEYDPTSVRNAIVREVIELGKSSNKRDRMEWNKLPTHLVVNVWREYIRKFKLEDLFIAKPSEANGLQVIEEMLNKRLKQAEVNTLNEVGQKIGASQESLEFIQLKLRGIEVMEVRIHNVMYDTSMEEHYIKQWSGEWLKNAKKEEDQLNEQEQLAEKLARITAAKNFARLATKNFVTAQFPKDEYTLLENLIQPLKETLLLENRTKSEMDLEVKRLEDIGKWLLVNKADQSQRQGHSR